MRLGLRVQRRKQKEHRTVHVIGYARFGARTGDVLTEQLYRTGTRHDVAVVLLGTSDVTRVTPPAVLAHRSVKLFGALLALGRPVVLCSLPTFPGDDRAAASLVDVVRRIQWPAVTAESPPRSHRPSSGRSHGSAHGRWPQAARPDRLDVGSSGPQGAPTRRPANPPGP